MLVLVPSSWLTPTAVVGLGIVSAIAVLRLPASARGTVGAAEPGVGPLASKLFVQSTKI